MNEAERRQLAAAIAHKILRDLRERAGLDLPEFHAMHEIEMFWADKLIFDMLPDSLSGTSPRDRLPLEFVDAQTEPGDRRIPTPVTPKEEVVDI